MSDELLYGVSTWLILPVLFASLLLGIECGFRLGRAFRSGVDDAVKSELFAIQGAILALLGLLLAFTVSMAVSRFDARKQFVIEEANAIGTASLRARLLPEPHRSEVASLFREYVDVRVQAHEMWLGAHRLREWNEQAAHLQGQLWAQAVAAGEQDRHAVTTGLFIQALNDVIDVYAKRRTATENHVPETVLYLIFLFAILGACGVGYGCGLGNRRNVIATLTFATLITLVILVILDLDRPVRGLIRIQQKNMLDLRDSLHKARP